MFETELEAFRDHLRTRYKLMAAWLRGEGSPNELTDWDMANPFPREPESPEQPPLVWLYRPPDLPHENYSPYSLLYDRVFSVGGRKWRRTGRSVDNPSTRFGRLDYPECKRRVEDWEKVRRLWNQVWSNETYNIQQEEGVKALQMVPHETVKGGRGYYTYAVFRYPDGQFGILSGCGDVPPAFGTHVNNTHLYPSREYINLVMKAIRDGMSREAARALANAKERDEAPDRLLKMLVDFEVSKRDAQGLVARLTP